MRRSRHCRDSRESSISAMFSQGAVLGRVVDLQPLGEGAGFDGLECFVERAEGVRVQIVHHEHDAFGVRVVDSEERVDLGRPVDPCASRPGVDAAAPGERFGPDEDRAGPVPDILRVLLEVMARRREYRITGMAEQLIRLLIHAHDRHCGIEGAVVDLEDVFHPGDKLTAGVRRDRPALLQVRTKPPFFRVRPIVE